MCPAFWNVGDLQITSEYLLTFSAVEQNIDMQKVFGERLKSLRTEKNLTQDDIAKILGCTQRKISYMERGVTEPDLQALSKLADYFGVSIDYLCGRTDY